jgi:dinuclear metal center YbgI/SA1388 family protein
VDEKECTPYGCTLFLWKQMKTVRVSDVIGIINKIAPSGYAEEWDNPGLQVGDPAAAVERLMVSLDACPSSVAAAIAENCSLLITHHPLIFKPLKRISRQDPVGEIVSRAISANLSIVSLHTNYDIADGGMNDLLAERLGLTDTMPLLETGSDELVKLSVFVPTGHEEPVKEALFRYSALIGNYDECSFQVAGTGTFRPLDRAVPFIGDKGSRSSVAESRIEVLLSRDNLGPAISALRKAHPYEEPAIDLYQLHNRGARRGLGRLGSLAAPMSLADFALFAKKSLSAAGVRMVGDGGRLVRRIAICGGSGASLLREASARGADLLLTGDLKYHEARDAQDLGIALVDVGHFASEQIMVQGLSDRLSRECGRLGFSVTVLQCSAEEDPFVFV